jgi:hypothetical protein
LSKAAALPACNNVYKRYDISESSPYEAQAVQIAGADGVAMIVFYAIEADGWHRRTPDFPLRLYKL